MSTLKISAGKFEPIAVVGIGALFAQSNNGREFWDNIVNGRDLITDIPSSHWLVEDYFDPDPAAVKKDKIYCKRAASLSFIDFDTMEFGIPPTAIPAIDPSQLLGLLVAKQVLNDATNGLYAEQDLSRVGVILGSSTLQSIQYMASRLQRPVIEKMMREFGLPEETIVALGEKIANCYTPLQENSFPGLLANVVAGRIANRFNLGGTNCVVDAACAGSLAALSMAVNELQMHTIDMVISGGVDTLNDIVMSMCFAEVQALSLTGDCRPFSDKADGTLLGEGLCMFALKRLSDAERQHNKIYAVIKGVGASSDGRSKSIYAPVAKGQSVAIRRAYEMSGYPLSSVELIEAHGTATKAGDVAEFAGLTQAFAEEKNLRRKSCALGSVKSQMGHTKSTAGAAGLFKMVMALRHKMLPPTIKVEQPNPAFDLETSALYLNTECRPWIRASDHPRRAGVSSFGFGGSNFHLAIEEYTGQNKAPRLRTFPSELIVITAENANELLTAATDLQKHIEQGESLAFIAHHSQMKHNPQHPIRLAIIASDNAQLSQKLAQSLAALQKDASLAFSYPGAYYSGDKATPGKVMFLFPGQGSQYLGMGADLTMAFDVCQDSWNIAADLDFADDCSLQEVVFPPPVFNEDDRKTLTERLTSTQWAQAALGMTSLSQLALLKAIGIQANYLAGHSFGELTALHASGAMDEKTLLKSARKRGELMAKASKTPGAMLSVAHPVNAVLDMLKTEKLSATAANFNSPNQLVLSGSIEDINAAESYFKSQNIQCRRLPVATGFHSSLIKPSQKPFRSFLDQQALRPPQIPVYANTTGQHYPSDILAMKDLLSGQLTQPVLFQPIIEDAWQAGVRTFIEVGAHHVLSQLTDQCIKALAPSEKYHVIALDHKGENGITSLWQALGQMLVAGLNPDFNALWAEYEIPTAAFKETKERHTIKINGSNYNKPYPREITLPLKNNPMESVTAAAVEIENSVSNISFEAAAPPMEPVTTPTPSTEFKEINDMTNPYLIQMYQSLQKELVDSHNMYQKVMAESHMNFLSTIGQLANQAAGNTGGAPTQAAAPMAIEMPAPRPAPPLAPMPQAPQPMAAPPRAPVQPILTPAPAMMPQAPVQPPAAAPPQQAVPPMADQAAPPPPVAAAPTPATAAPAPATAPGAAVTLDNLEQLLLNVVSEKTGYPIGMINKDMSIESDLGIDSIKRVEILSTITRQAPNLPKIDSTALSQLQTLGDIVDYMKKHS